VETGVLAACRSSAKPSSPDYAVGTATYSSSLNREAAINSALVAGETVKAAAVQLGIAAPSAKS